LTNAIASGFASKNIRCNVISPGAVKSEGHKHLVNDPGKAVEMFRWFIGPMGRIGEPLEIAYCALYLASDESAFTTGAHIVIDGGLTKSLKRPNEDFVKEYVKKYLDSLK
jgi:2-keto-3-deoxy-L-fuconate dehydrogenase